MWRINDGRPISNSWGCLMLSYPRVIILRLILQNTSSGAIKIIKWKYCPVSKDFLALYFKTMSSSFRKLGDKVKISVDMEHGFKREKHSNRKWLVFFPLSIVAQTGQKISESELLTKWRNLQWVSTEQSKGIMVCSKKYNFCFSQYPCIGYFLLYLLQFCMLRSKLPP